jgi:hypothetical protein
VPTEYRKPELPKTSRELRPFLVKIADELLIWLVVEIRKVGSGYFKTRKEFIDAAVITRKRQA